MQTQLLDNIEGMMFRGRSHNSRPTCFPRLEEGRSSLVRWKGVFLVLVVVAVVLPLLVLASCGSWIGEGVRNGLPPSPMREEEQFVGTSEVDVMV